MTDDPAVTSPAAPVSPPSESSVATREEAEHAALGPLLLRLGRDGKSLIHQEIALATQEVQRSAVLLAKESAVIAMGGFFIALGLLVLLVFVILALGRIMGGEYWLS